MSPIEGALVRGPGERRLRRSRTLAEPVLPVVVRLAHDHETEVVPLEVLEGQGTREAEHEAERPAPPGLPTPRPGRGGASPAGPQPAA